MIKKNTNYFFKSFITILLAAGVFFVLKEFLPSKIFNVEVPSANGILIDSMALSAIDNSNFISDNKNEILSKTDVGTSVDSTENIYVNLSDQEIDQEEFGNLEVFFEKLYLLEQNKNKKVRVAYFSDSMTDGDLIVQDIREEYQKKYGGRGVGFVGITSLSAGSRYSVVHSYSKNWYNQSYLKTHKPSRPFGIDGQVATVSGRAPSWVFYQAGKLENSAALYEPTLFYGRSQNFGASVTIKQDNESEISASLSPSNLLNTLTIEGAPGSVKIVFNKADSIPFYGINFDDGRGFHIDNFSIRGNSGLPLSLLNKSLMNAFDDVLHYDLVILHYGANVLSYKVRDYSWYKKTMTGVVNHLKECFPNAAFLIVSTADKGDRVNSVMQTSPAVEPLIKAQSEYAANAGAGFLNLYELMGGYGSMIKWVSSTPPLANKDYTHFSIKGANKIGLLIFGDLDKRYQNYRKRKYGFNLNQ